MHWSTPTHYSVARPTTHGSDQGVRYHSPSVSPPVKQQNGFSTKGAPHPDSPCPPTPLGGPYTPRPLSYLRGRTTLGGRGVCCRGPGAGTTGEDKRSTRAGEVDSRRRYLMHDLHFLRGAVEDFVKCPYLPSAVPPPTPPPRQPPPVSLLDKLGDRACPPGPGSGPILPFRRFTHKSFIGPFCDTSEVKTFKIMFYVGLDSKRSTSLCKLIKVPKLSSFRKTGTPRLLGEVDEVLKITSSLKKLIPFYK